MARTLDPVCKLCRREGMKLYLKGKRCDTKCALDRRNNSLPGMHGHRRPKHTEYGTRLREKQKLKRFYGLFERQFRRYLSLAAKSKANTGEVLMTLMERRLDNVVYRLGFAASRAAARQLVTHGHVALNGHHCNIPSLLLKPGDSIVVKSRKRSLDLVKHALADSPPPVPDFLEITNVDPPQGRMTRMPGRGDVDPRIAEIREQLIIELATR